MMDYPHLVALLAVEREGTFGAAANALGISKSAISQTIRLLEQRVGGATFERSPTRPTALGKRLCRHVENVQLLETKLFLTHGDIFKTANIEPSPIKIAINDDIQSRCFLEALSPRTDSQNQFLFDVIVSTEHDALISLQAEAVKAAITSVNFPIPDVNTYPLGAQEFIATASPTFVRKFFADGVTPEQLEIAPTVSYSRYPSLCERMIKRQSGSTCAIPSNLLPSSHGVLYSCLEGLAWGMNPIHLAHDYLESGELVELWPNQSELLPMYWHVSRTLDQLLGDVTATVKDTAADLQLKPLDG